MFRPDAGRRTRPRCTSGSADTLRESVRLHMRSDVPVGAFLSSGIDSTAVVALAREFNPNILTFTVGYDVPGYSEIEVAQDSARHLERDHDPDQDRAAGHDGRPAARSSGTWTTRSPTRPWSRCTSWPRRRPST